MMNCNGFYAEKRLTELKVGLKVSFLVGERILLKLAELLNYYSKVFPDNL